MGRSGPRPDPTALRVLRGNPSKRALPANEPKPAAVDEGMPPPDYLDDAAAKEWRRVAPLLARNGLLTELDVDALTAYCHAFTVWKHANERLRLDGMIVATPNGYPVQSPYLSIANKALLQMRGLMSEFGMTPSARSRVARTEAPAPDNPLARFVNRKRE